MVWGILIFICLVRRAIHIEVAYLLDTSSFIQVLPLFIAPRDPVIEIRSDKSTNFVGVEKEVKLSIDNWNPNAIPKFLLQKQRNWVFNTTAASHHRSVWERKSDRFERR